MNRRRGAEGTQVTGEAKGTKGKHDDAAETLARLLTATPNLRARFFANPTRQVGKSLPLAKSWHYEPPEDRKWWRPWRWPGSPWRYRVERGDLAKATLEKITKQISQGAINDGGIAASVNTDSVFEEYFAPIVKVSQRSFTSVYVLSILAFLAGLSLIVVGVIIALHPPAGTNSTVVASIFGGSGAVSALGAVYAMAISGIRQATVDHARTRIVLTAFATQLGQLRAIIEQKTPQNGQTLTPASQRRGIDNGKKNAIDYAKELNSCIQDSMAAALKEIPSQSTQKSQGDQKPQQPAGNAVTDHLRALSPRNRSSRRPVKDPDV